MVVMVVVMVRRDGCVSGGPAGRSCRRQPRADDLPARIRRRARPSSPLSLPPPLLPALRRDAGVQRAADALPVLADAEAPARPHACQLGLELRDASAQRGSTDGVHVAHRAPGAIHATATAVASMTAIIGIAVGKAGVAVVAGVIANVGGSRSEVGGGRIACPPVDGHAGAAAATQPRWAGPLGAGRAG